MYPARERFARLDKGFDSNEIMEVFEYLPGRTHFTPGQVSAAIGNAIALFSAGRGREGLARLAAACCRRPGARPGRSQVQRPLAARLRP